MSKGKRQGAPSLASLGVEDEKDLLRRAYAAIYRGEQSGSFPVPVPSRYSAVEVHGSHWYVVLRGGCGSVDRPMAVYRLKNDGILRRLRRWPSAIQA